MINTIKRIQNGEFDLINELILKNEEFIYSFIKKYENKFDDYEELKQEAIVTYIHLIKKYNFNGYFSTYIYTKMNQYISNFILSNLERIVKIEDRVLICKHFYNKCVEFYQHKPSFPELRLYLNIRSAYVYQVYCYANNYNFYESYNDKSYGNVDENYEIVERNIDSDLFKKNILEKNLTKKQSDSIKFYFGFESCPKSLVELGKLENTSRQTISDRVENGKRKLKKVIENGVY